MDNRNFIELNHRNGLYKRHLVNDLSRKFPLIPVPDIWRLNTRNLMILSNISQGSLKQCMMMPSSICKKGLVEILEQAIVGLDANNLNRASKSLVSALFAEISMMIKIFQ